jgi:AcrR family transcriptional regulator
VRIVQKDGRKRRGDRSRAEILERVVHAASTDGLENVTFGRIADELGLSKGNLTVLFGDKTSLQLAAFEAAIARVMEVVIKPALSKRTPNARVRTLVDGWFRYVGGGVFPGGCFLFGTAHEYRAREGPLRDKAIEYLGRWRALLEREFDAAGASKPEEAAFSVLAFQNTAHLFLLLGDRRSFERAHRGALRVIAQTCTEKDC